MHINIQIKVVALLTKSNTYHFMLGKVIIGTIVYYKELKEVRTTTAVLFYTIPCRLCVHQNSWLCGTRYSTRALAYKGTSAYAALYAFNVQ